MTKEEIYEHLAQVYLGKRAPEKKDLSSHFSAQRMGKIILLILIINLAFYSLTAFLSQRKEFLRGNIVFALNNSPIRLRYNFNEPYPQVKDFTLPIPKTDIAKYNTLNFAVRGMEQGYPGIIKVSVRNARNETSFVYVDDVNVRWKRVSVAFEDFKEITDWSTATEISFVLEAWNVSRRRGGILIDEISFSK